MSLSKGWRGMRGESGQVLPWAVFLIFLFIGISAMVVDLGHGILVKRELQASADAAALAAAATLPAANYAQVAQTYSAGTGGKNTYTELSVGTPTIKPLCLTTVAAWGYPCTSTSPNAVQVTQTATVPTFFAGIMGIKQMTISATAMASKGSKPKPYNVAIILDTTPSMNSTDSNCKNSKGQSLTQLQCATTAFQELLQGLDPSLDRISLFTFPNITTTSVGNDYDCSSSNPTVGPYTFPSSTATSLSTMPYSVTTTTGSGRNQTTTTTTVQETYQVAGFSTDYRSSDTATSLSSTSNLANAVGGSSCQGIQTSNENTYYAAAIYAAQAALTAEQAANKGTQNAIIFLSDGNATAKVQSPGGSFSPGSNDMVSSSSQSTTYATASGTYPSWEDQCAQGVAAANYATSMGTTVYTIAYGSPTSSNSSNCGSDVYNRNTNATGSGLTPCQAMQQMSTGWSSGDYSHFFSDYFGGNNGCSAAGAAESIGDLNNIVNAILGSMTGARLIPNSTT
ncbi:MAG: pilus assembly protein TadG-related protein [Terracidiphilus sp.]